MLKAVVDLAAVGPRIEPPAAPRPRFSSLERHTVSLDDWRLHLDRDPQSPLAGRLVAAASAQDWTVWAVGEITAYAGRDVEHADATSDLAADLARHAVGVHTLRGRYVVVARQASTGIWRLWTDPAGSIHLYVLGTDRIQAVGTSFRGLTSLSRRRIDAPGLCAFLGCGFFLGDRTLYDDIHVVPPAMEITFDRDGVVTSRRRTWEWRHAPNTARSMRDLTAGLDAVLRPVARRMLVTGRTALPLSGGLDSRTIAGIAPPESPPWAFSYGFHDRSLETRIAARVARARGLPFESFVVGIYLFDQLETIAGCLEGFQDLTQARQAAVLPELGAHADYVLAAHWGDVWLDDMGWHGSPAATASEVAGFALAKMLKRGRRWLLDNVAAPLVDEPPEMIVAQQVAEGMRPFEAIEDPDFRVKIFKTWNWSFRWTVNSLRAYLPAAFPRLPFYDPDVMRFFETVPTSQVAGRRLQIEWLKEYAPDLARIAWQPYDTNLYRVDWYNSWLLPKRALKKMLRSLRGGAPPSRNWEIQFLGAEERRRLRDSLLSRPHVLHELVSPEKIAELLDGFLAAPNAADGYTVSMLFSLATWLEDGQEPAGLGNEP